MYLEKVGEAREALFDDFQKKRGGGQAPLAPPGSATTVLALVAFGRCTANIMIFVTRSPGNCIVIVLFSSAKY